MSLPPLPERETLRLHQANERTLLAWTRTALALMGFGFVIARFGLFLGLGGYAANMRVAHLGDLAVLEHWFSLARHTPLAILSDLDGTLIDLAPTPDEARPDPPLLELLHSLAMLPGVRLMIVSGRPHAVLDRYFSDPALWLVAEHGAWSRGEGAWTPTIQLDPQPVRDLADRLGRIAETYRGAWIEWKTVSCTAHHRQMDPSARSAFVVEVSVVIDQFLSTSAGFERVDGNQVIEVRPVAARKSFAVSWAKQQLDSSSRLIAIGDDLTDEHLFAALGPLDEGVLVKGGIPRRSRARWAVDNVAGARVLLSWLYAVRRGDDPRNFPLAPIEVASQASRSASHSLLVVSNRLPDLRSSESVDPVRRKNAGGLVSALEPILSARNGLWLGWSGRVVSEDEEPSSGTDEASPPLAWFDFKQSWQRDYYNGFCNASLWPLFHSFPGRVVLDERTWASYVEVHEVFADEALKYLKPDDTVWVHDYHLLLLGRALRARGHRGPIGLFLHVPFPALDIFRILPWDRELIDAMLEFDLIGFHTHGHLANFVSCAGTLLGSVAGPRVVEHRGQFTSVGVFPIGIIPESFQETASAALAHEIEGVTRSLGSGMLVLGVDRLDYTKGIPERLLAFGRLLELFPEWRGKVSLIQISVPSRADVPEYAEQRENVERIVGRVNGQFGEADWVPIRYLYRGYGRQHLSQLYRAARVGCVTPLRDGMNLVAKEYVAAQNPEDPGVLLLSEFAGAADEMTDAILTNPYFTDGLARDLDRALRVSLEERQSRHARLLAVVARTNAQSWAASFLDTLAECRGAVRTS